LCDEIIKKKKNVFNFARRAEKIRGIWGSGRELFNEEYPML
jgi:protein involved in ribonucleotide reduction